MDGLEDITSEFKYGLVPKKEKMAFERGNDMIKSLFE